MARKTRPASKSIALSEKKASKRKTPVLVDKKRKPLDTIPEGLGSTTAPGYLQSLVRRMGYQRDARSSTKNPLVDSLTGFGRKPRLKASISAPKTVPKRHTSAPSKLSADITPESPSTPSLKFDSTRYSSVPDNAGNRSSEPRQDKFELAPPHLSPMEYVRMYLIEKANAKKENRSCELPEPGRRWFWAPKLESLYIIPTIPASIKRGHTTKVKGKGFSWFSKTSSEKDAATEIVCPRLSLHLDNQTFSFSTMANLEPLEEWDEYGARDVESGETPMMSGALLDPESAQRLIEEESVQFPEGLKGHIHTAGHRKSLSAGTDVTKFTECLEEAMRAYSGEDQARETSSGKVVSAMLGENDCVLDSNDPDGSDGSSKYSQESDNTITVLETMAHHTKQNWLTPEKDSSNKQHLASPSSAFKDSLDSATEYDGSSPMAHWPVASGNKKTRTEMIQGVIDDAGGLHVRTMRQPQITESDSTQPMMAELQPSPLRIPSNGWSRARRASPDETKDEANGDNRDQSSNAQEGVGENAPDFTFHTPTPRRITTGFDVSLARLQVSPFRFPSEESMSRSNGGDSPTLPEYQPHAEQPASPPQFHQQTLDLLERGPDEETGVEPGEMTIWPDYQAQNERPVGQSHRQAALDILESNTRPTFPYEYMPTGVEGGVDPNRTPSPLPLLYYPPSPVRDRYGRPVYPQETEPAPPQQYPHQEGARKRSKAESLNSWLGLENPPNIGDQTIVPSYEGQNTNNERVQEEARTSTPVYQYGESSASGFGPEGTVDYYQREDIGPSRFEERSTANRLAQQAAAYRFEEPPSDVAFAGPSTHYRLRGPLTSEPFEEPTDRFGRQEEITSHPRHIPIVVDPHSSLRSNMTTHERLALSNQQRLPPPPVPSAAHSAWSHSPSPKSDRGRGSSRLGSFFGKKKREKSSKTPTSPTTNWNSYENPSPAPPCSQPWGAQQAEGPRNTREERAHFFRRRVEQASASDRNRTFSGAQRAEIERDSLVNIQGTIEQCPIPPPDHFTFNEPTVPGMSTVQTGGPAFENRAARLDETGVATYREKRPNELSVDTNKLRKKKSESALKSAKSSSGLRSVFWKAGTWRSKDKDKDDKDDKDKDKGKGKEV